MAEDKCAECGGTEHLRIVRPMIGWGNGYQGTEYSRIWCMKCCRKHHGHYQLVREIKPKEVDRG